MQQPAGLPVVRLTSVLKAGNVMNIEPGLEFIEPRVRQWQEKGDAAAVNWDRVEALKPYGGIRIEDNVVVTETGSNNLTRQAFATL